MDALDPAGTKSGHEIGRIRRIPLREVWSHEALDFTTWLQENVDVLVEATGLQLNGVEREQAAGGCSVDLVALFRGRPASHGRRHDRDREPDREIRVSGSTSGGKKRG